MLLAKRGLRYRLAAPEREPRTNGYRYRVVSWNRRRPLHGPSPVQAHRRLVRRRGRSPRADARRARPYQPSQGRPLFDDLDTWLARQSPNTPARTPLAGAVRYARARLARLRPWLDNGTLELDNNTVERAIRGIAVGRKNRFFVGSEAGGATAATAYTLIETAKLNGVDPRARIADTLNRVQDYETNRIHELMPWNREHKTPP